MCWLSEEVIRYPEQSYWPEGALRAGAGRIRIATCKSHAAGLAIAIPEALVVGLGETSEGDIDPGEIPKILELAADTERY